LKHQKIENLYVNYLERQRLLTRYPQRRKPLLEKEMAQQINIALTPAHKMPRDFYDEQVEHMKYKDIAANSASRQKPWSGK